MSDTNRSAVAVEEEKSAAHMFHEKVKLPKVEYTDINFEEKAINNLMMFSFNFDQLRSILNVIVTN